jgi:hypothetical protein
MSINNTFAYNDHVYVNKSTKAIRHFLYSRGWKQTKKGSWRSAYSPISFDSVSDVLRFDIQLRKGKSPSEAYKAVPKFTFERTNKDVQRRRGF